MFVRVDEPWDDAAAGGVDDVILCAQAVERAPVDGADRQDATTPQEDRHPAPRLGGEDVAVFDERDHPAAPTDSAGRDGWRSERSNRSPPLRTCNFRSWAESTWFGSA